jgi:hypothetical protein
MNAYGGNVMNIKPDPQAARDKAWLDAGLAGLRAEMARLKAPARIERELFTRARLAHLGRAPSPLWRILLQQFFVPAVAIGVVLALFVPFLAGGPLAPDLSGEAELAPQSETPFYALGGTKAELDLSQGVVVATELPRRILLDFGLPIDPGQLGQPIKADVLVGARGEILGVRFTNRTGEVK